MFNGQTALLVGVLSLRPAGENQNQCTQRQQTISYMDSRTHLQELWRSCGNAKPCWGLPSKKPLCGNTVAFLLWCFFRPCTPATGSGWSLLRRQTCPIHRFSQETIDCENRTLKLYLQLVPEKHFPLLGNIHQHRKTAFVGGKKSQTFQIKKTLTKDTVHLCRRCIFHDVTEDLGNFLCIYCLTCLGGG